MESINWIEQGKVTIGLKEAIENKSYIGILQCLNL